MENLEIDSSETVQKDTKEEKKWYVYMHTNKINQKKYIGITCQEPKNRWGKDGNGYKKQSYFYRAIQKYGWDNFTHEILFKDIGYEQACEIEKNLIAKYNTTDRSFGYNRATGGDVNYGYTFTMSEKSRQKMSEARKGMVFTEEHRNKIGESNRGRQVSEGTREKISKSRIGKYNGEDNPNYGNHKLAGKNNPMYGKHHSDETRMKISQNRKGKNLGNGNKNPSGKKNYFYDNHEFSGINNGRATPIYCKQLDELFWGAQDAENKYNIAHQTIAKSCRNKRKSAGKHPETNEPLSWTYVFDNLQTDGTIIQGAISLGYITEERVNEYLNNLRK